MAYYDTPQERGRFAAQEATSAWLDGDQQISRDIFREIAEDLDFAALGAAIGTYQSIIKVLVETWAAETGLDIRSRLADMFRDIEMD